MSLSPISGVVIAFLSGSIPFGLLLGRLRGVDVRRTGSGNIGATNVMRAAGRSIGVLTFALDALKGSIGPILGRLCGWSPGWAEACVLAAVAGHCFSPLLKGRGGKGVATFVGGCAVVDPVATALGGIFFAGALFSWRYVALASGIMCLAVAGGFALRAEDGAAGPAAILLAAVIILLRHRSNWRRILAGVEPRALDGARQGGGPHV